MARIICGANELENANFDGKTIEQLKSELRTVLNIPDNATILLNGVEVQNNIALRSGDELEFVKAAGDKGSQ